ncbi:MAG: alanyl-tRNA editing protein [Anaerolineae bacterium]|nr:alanyl-tRNA editing protein [Anaerolineae bacterium]
MTRWSSRAARVAKGPQVWHRLYFDHPYLTHFTAQVVERLEWAGRPAVVLDQTAFYPTGGGQPHDTGMLKPLEAGDAGEGCRDGGVEVAVVEVVEREADGAVIHLLAAPLDAVQVEGRIDWERRFDLMQQHTGQHLLSAAFVRCCEANTVSFHLTADCATIDLDRVLSADELAQAEALASQAVFDNRPVSARFVPGKEVHRLALRKPVARSGPLRVVEIPDFDCSACGGTHVRATGEIGLIKIVRSERRGAETRVEFMCGRRALADYQVKNALLLDMARDLSVGYWELPEAIRRLDDELREARRELRHAQDALFDAEAGALWHAAARLGDLYVVQAYLASRAPDELKLLAQRLIAHPQTAVLLGAGQAGDKGHLVFARSADLDFHAGALLGQACQLIGGRGGGRPDFAQGGGPDAAQVPAALDAAFSALSASLSPAGEGADG